MHVQVLVMGKYVCALLDTGADNNYLAQHMVDRLGLNLSVCSKRHGQCMMNVIHLDDFEMVLDIAFIVKAKVSVMPYIRCILIGDGDHPCFIKAIEILNKQGNEASSTRKKHNETLGRGQCLATLESKSRVVAESVNLMDELQSSMASSSGPIEFQRKLGDCSILGRGPKQQMKHESSVTVGQMQCRLGNNRSLGEGMAH
ncbi:hypothetical protein ACOSP7_010265 [Xanthoceras sorbifolium]